MVDKSVFAHLKLPETASESDSDLSTQPAKSIWESMCYGKYSGVVRDSILLILSCLFACLSLAGCQLTVKDMVRPECAV